jgi:hypothetical protein
MKKKICSFLLAPLLSLTLFSPISSQAVDGDTLSNIGESISHGKIINQEQAYRNIKAGENTGQGSGTTTLLYSRGAFQSSAKPVVLVDFPGANWKGEDRPGNWGKILLSKDHTTIYIRHEGSQLSWDSWNTPAEKGAKVVTLPHNWDEKAADRLLRPEIEAALKSGKSVHLVGDLNVTMSGHIFNNKNTEDQWGAKLADYSLKIAHTSSPDAFRIFAAHSHGTIVPAYMSNTTLIQYGIIASPRGDQSLAIIKKNPGIPIDLIRGRGDAPSLRLTTDIESLSKNSNCRILELQGKGTWSEVHRKLDGGATAGSWEVKEYGSRQEVKGPLANPVAARLQQIMSPQINEVKSISALPSGVDVYQAGKSLTIGNTLTKSLQSDSCRIDPKQLNDHAQKKISEKAMDLVDVKGRIIGKVGDSIKPGLGSVVGAGVTIIDINNKLKTAAQVGQGKASPEALKETVPHVVMAWKVLSEQNNLSTITFHTFNNTYNMSGNRIQTSGSTIEKKKFSSTAPGIIGQSGFDPKTDSIKTTRRTQTQTQTQTYSSPKINVPTRTYRDSNCYKK